MNQPQTNRTGLPSLGWKKTILYSLLPTLLLLIAAELAARIAEIWIPPHQADLGLGFTPDSRVFLQDPNNPERMITNPNKVGIVFQDSAFLRAKPPRTLRIFTLGGSSVNYLQAEFVQLALRLKETLKNRFDNVEIINCGGHAYGSHRLVSIAKEVLDYSPDLLLLYSGHNEFEELEQFTYANMKTLSLQRFIARSALCRFVRDRIAARKIEELRKRHAQRMQDGSTKPWKLDLTDEEKTERMKAYERNLSLIIEMCKVRSVPIIIGSVPSNLWNPRLDRAEDAERYKAVKDMFAHGKYEEGLKLGREILKKADRRQSSDIENSIIRSLAAKYGLPLADVENAVIQAEPHHVPGETLIRDWCHLNVAGNAIWIEQYEPKILELFR